MAAAAGAVAAIPVVAVIAALVLALALAVTAVTQSLPRVAAAAALAASGRWRLAQDHREAPNPGKVVRIAQTCISVAGTSTKLAKQSPNIHWSSSFTLSRQGVALKSVRVLELVAYARHAAVGNGARLAVRRTENAALVWLPGGSELGWGKWT